MPVLCCLSRPDLFNMRLSGQEQWELAGRKRRVSPALRWSDSASPLPSPVPHLLREALGTNRRSPHSACWRQRGENEAKPQIRLLAGGHQRQKMKMWKGQRWDVPLQSLWGQSKTASLCQKIIVTQTIWENS